MPQPFTQQQESKEVMSHCDVKETALVVDDEATNRLVLSALLKQMHFNVIEAEDGRQAIDRFKARQPDIIFMDIMMPGIDGYQAIRTIKELSKDIFIPIIVLTALNDESTLSRCITEGGDDVLTKPFDAMHLKSKIYSMMRIKELHESISHLYTQMKYEEKLAETVFTRAVTAPNIESDNVRTLSWPASTFSGDMILTAYGPGGDFHLLLGDFTGHGLTAAIGALPVAEVFRAMVNKGYNADNVLTAINLKLHTMLPADVFMAACYIQISNDLNKVDIYNCGLPEVLIWDDSTPNKLRSRIPSSFFPLGIQSSFPSKDIVHRAKLYPDNKIYIYSDGVIESRNNDGEEYGQPRLEASLTASNPQCNSFDTIIKYISEFCGSSEQHDDITLVEILFNHELVNRNITTEIAELKQTDQERELSLPPVQSILNEFEFNVTFQGKRLQQNEIVPLLMSNLQEMSIPKSALTNLYTILTELITNALDHGVLKLDSSCKSTPEGFVEYFAKREKRLNIIEEGYVSVYVHGEANSYEGKLNICIEDSGDGFDWTDINNQTTNTGHYHGRGIPLVRKLCSQVEYCSPGNKVKAVFEYKD